MRKIAMVLCVLLVCLLCGPNGNASALHSVAHSAAPSSLVLDRSASEQWLCERKFNSDLGLPRIAAQTSPATLTPPALRDARSILRQGVKCGVACGRDGGVVSLVSEYRFIPLCGRASVVDYYVYRLRRLII